VPSPVEAGRLAVGFGVVHRPHGATWIPWP
jgi:hypothetical protein